MTGDDELPEGDLDNVAGGVQTTEMPREIRSAGNRF